MNIRNNFIVKSYRINKKRIISRIPLKIDFDLSALKYFCLFIGHDRSGSTLIASILNAHPQAIISIEENVLKLLLKGFTKDQIFNLIIKNSYRFNNILNSKWTGYNYKIPGLLYEKKYIKIIGDKKSSVTTKLIGKQNNLIYELIKKINLPIKVINIIRNPFDNISTLIKNDVRSIKHIQEKHFTYRIKTYFKYAEILNKLINEKNIDIHRIYHEDFIKYPNSKLRELLNFLEIDVCNSFITNSCKIIYKKPHFSRYDINWSKKNILEVEKNIGGFSFLKRYNFYEE